MHIMSPRGVKSDENEEAVERLYNIGTEESRKAIERAIITAIVITALKLPVCPFV